MFFKWQNIFGGFLKEIIALVKIICDYLELQLMRLILLNCSCHEVAQFE
jgi:hypothetical protein